MFGWNEDVIGSRGIYGVILQLKKKERSFVQKAIESGSHPVVSDRTWVVDVE